MVGRELGQQFPPKTNKPGETYLEVENLTAQYSLLRDVSFQARRGEIVGLAGLDGSGRTETAGKHLRHRHPQVRHHQAGTARWSRTATPANPSRTALPSSPRSGELPASSAS